MRITVMGAGAIGGLAGAYMARAGEDVTLVDRWVEHVDAINRDGMLIDALRGETRIKVKAITPDRLTGPLELVFLATKSQHTVEATKQLLPHLTAESVIVSLQNGQNEEAIAELVGARRVIGALPGWGAALVDPSHLELEYVGTVYIGELDGRTTERVLEVQRLLGLVTKCELSEDILGRAWGKQVYMTQVVMTALVDAPMDDVMQPIRNRLMGIALIREAVTVADAAGARPPILPYFRPELMRSREPQVVAEALQMIVKWLATNKQQQAAESTKEALVRRASGMWWDLAYRKRQSETRWLTGEIVRRADLLGVPVPLNRRCAEMIYEIEDGHRQLSWANLDELAEHMRAHGEQLVPPPGCD